MRLMRDVAIVSLSALFGLSLVFFLFREKELLQKIENAESQATYYAGLAVDSNITYRFEGTILGFDPVSSEVLIDVESRWSPSKEPARLSIPLGAGAIIVARTGVESAGIITNIKEHHLKSAAEIPQGTFAFIAVSSDSQGKSRIHQITLGEVLTPL